MPAEVDGLLNDGAGQKGRLECLYIAPLTYPGLLRVDLLVIRRLGCVMAPFSRVGPLTGTKRKWRPPSVKASSGQDLMSYDFLGLVAVR